MDTFISVIVNNFRAVGQAVVAALSFFQQKIFSAIGHGFKMLLLSSMLTGLGIFALLRTVLQYTPFAVSYDDAAEKWWRLMGENADFFAWLFYKVLALDVGINLILSAFGLIAGAHIVYWTISGALLLAKRL